MALYFKLEEFTYSDTAKALGIDNTPPKDVRFNIAQLINFLDDLRSEWAIKLMTDDVISDFSKGGLVIKSGYRCPKLNKAVGGKATSAHLTGFAADIKPIKGTVPQFYNFFKEWLEKNNYAFDELIQETKGKTQWVHFALYSINGEQRKKVLKLKVS